nr:MAG: AI-2E family transporter [Pseudomonadota bacterium]
MRVERQVLFWLAALILLILAALVLRSVLLPFVAGMVIAYALNPLADRLVALGLPRVWASAIVVTLLVMALVAAVVFLIPIIARQVQQLVEVLPGEIERVRGLVEESARERLGSHFADFQAWLDTVAAELSRNWASVIGYLAQSVWSQGMALVNFASLLLITPVVVFYLLVDWYSMLEKIDSWLPRDHAPTIRRLATEINAAVSAFIRGQGLICLILGALYAVGLTWADIPYGLVIGLAAGLLSFVPFVGFALGLITALTVALIQYWPETLPLLKVLAVFAVGQALDSALLSPRIVGPKVGLHPVWLIFSLFVFGYLFGFVGVLVAVPMAAAIAVLVRFALEVYLSSSIYKGRTATALAPADLDQPLEKGP